MFSTEGYAITFMVLHHSNTHTQIRFQSFSFLLASVSKSEHFAFIATLNASNVVSQNLNTLLVVHKIFEVFQISKKKVLNAKIFVKSATYDQTTMDWKHTLIVFSYEAGMLEDPSTEALPEMYEMTCAPEKAPDEPVRLSIEFKRGVPVCVRNEQAGVEKKDPLKLFLYLNEIA